MIEPCVVDVKEAAKENTLFRKVLFTAAESQLVIMSLLPGEEIGSEVHDGDQLLYAAKGDGRRVPFEKGMVFCVPAGARHNVINRSDEPMKLFTFCAAPQHAAGTIHRTKVEAEAAEREGPRSRAELRGLGELEQPSAAQEEPRQERQQ